MENFKDLSKKLDQLFFAIAKTEAKIEALADIFIGRERDTIQGDIGDEYEKFFYNNFDHLSEKYRSMGVDMPQDPVARGDWKQPGRKEKPKIK